MATFAAAVEAWRSRIAARADGIPVDFILAWIRHESGGNPCSVGIIEDGFNVEAGIIQSYHPDDDRFGATSAQLRASCKGTTSTQTRPLTDDEKDLQAKVAVNLVKNAVSVARSRNVAGWPETSSDFGKLVKLHHGLPIIAKVLLPAAHKAGSAGSFGDFKAWVLARSVDELRAIEDAAGVTSRAISRRHASVCSGGCKPLGKILDNAETAGAYWSGSSLGSARGGLFGLLDKAFLVPAAVLAAAVAFFRKGTS